MRGLNEFNLKKIWLEAKGNVASTSSNLDYSIQVNDAEGAEENHFENKEMNGIQDKQINNIELSLQHLLCASLTRKKTAKNQKNTLENQENLPEMTGESDFVFSKPKIYRCYYCRKLFYHTATYRRHMIYQLKRLYWCSVCKRGFVSKMWFKRHKLFCYIP